MSQATKIGVTVGIFATVGLVLNAMHAGSPSSVANLGDLNPAFIVLASGGAGVAAYLVSRLT